MPSCLLSRRIAVSKLPAAACSAASVTKTDERALAEALGVSSSGGRSKPSSSPHPPSSSLSSSAPSASAKMASMSLFSIPSTSTMSSPSPQSPPASSSSSSTAPPLAALSSPPSNIPFITLRRGQSPPHMTGDGGIKSDGVFPSGNEGTLSPSSVASRSAVSVKP
ncbi:hypothetical protein HID58_078851 [Brassica napus]|uniref:Uncharacterized protein n=1 Tax=Brassica napus TaxID=3708 RepID=A0ABQ7YV61_BRANA|nr:hypothetical protein HID58_078851 [Brassica napus]